MDSLQLIRPYAKLVIDTISRQSLAKKTGMGALGLGALIVAVRSLRSSKKKRRQVNKEDLIEVDIDTVTAKKAVDNEKFNRQLRQLIKIVIPGWRSKEFFLILFHTSFLVARTFLSIVVARLDGAIVKTVVSRKPRQFVRLMLLWIGLAVPATYVNSMIHFLESKVSIALRSRLMNHAIGLYMKNEVYYRTINLDDRITNPDQLICEDVSRWCSQLAHLHSHLSKPVLDIVLMTTQLVLMGRESTGGAQSLWAGVIAVVMITGTARILRWARPPFGRMVAKQAKLEGDLRYCHSRLITNAEEISFYGGSDVEKGFLDLAYLRLVKQMNFIYQKRILYTMLEGFFMKYCWSATGFTMMAIPMFYPKAGSVAGEAGTSGRTQLFVTARSLLISAADAIERMLSALKEVSELAGYTERVSEMLTVFEDVAAGRYQKAMLKDSNLSEFPAPEVQEGNHIELLQVPIISPNGDVLVKALSFVVKSGMHLLITGPNGCGKSSMFRILGGLWPVLGGKLTKPGKQGMFYIPQRPYLSMGCLRDQVIYPDSIREMHARGRSDAFLLDILEKVNLQYIVDREGGWDAVRVWQDTLSGGEKQRMGMARLFYHCPKFAILDECTSAVSMDVEGKMYDHAKALGITLMSVSHRPSLWKYHDFILQFDGEGGWKFNKLNADEMMSMKEEKVKLESQLSGIPKVAARLKEICSLLGESSVVLDDSQAFEADKLKAAGGNAMKKRSSSKSLLDAIAGKVLSDKNHP